MTMETGTLKDVSLLEPYHCETDQEDQNLCHIVACLNNVCNTARISNTITGLRLLFVFLF